MTHLELAQLCRDVYTPESIPVNEWIGGMGPVARVLHGMMGRPTVVVFRGTCDLAGWIEDLDIRSMPYPFGRVHAGFRRCWDVVRSRVVAAVAGTPCIVTGHSLGGAMATLAAAELPSCTELVTFGCPRVGDASFALSWPASSLKTTRYVYGLDPVPLCPGLLAGYQHVCMSRWWDGGAWCDGYSLGHLLKLVWHSAASFLTSLGDPKAFCRRLWADHAIENYVRALS